MARARRAALGLLMSTLGAILGLPAPAAAAPCALVFGHGRNASAGDAAANELWNGVNLRFNAQVAASLQAAGQAVQPLVLSVTATDLGANARALLFEASRQGCNRVVETTVFADAAAQTLVARLRVYPLLAQGAATLRIGEPVYTNQRDFEFTETTLERIRPAVLGDEMAREYLAQRGSMDAEP
jgi:hypothetical protein